jgi:hypothetical protein
MNNTKPLACILPNKLRKTKNLNLVDLNRLEWEKGVNIPNGKIGDLNQNDHLLIYPSSRIWLTNYKKITPKVSLIITEPKSVHSHYYNNLWLLRFKFHKIFVRYKAFSNNKNNVIAIPIAYSWISKNIALDTIEKTKLTSLIASNKSQLEGHKLRHCIINRIKNIGSVDVMGRGYSPFNHKEDGLLPYMFSIIVENCKEENYFSEKLIDCLLCGAIPVYWGAPDISDYFDTSGMIIFNNLDEFMDILPTLTVELYETKKNEISINYEVAKKLSSTNNDRIINSLEKS